MPTADQRPTLGPPLGRHASLLKLLTAAALLPALAACTKPDGLLRETDDATARDYVLYVPPATRYESRPSLVVVCHGGGLEAPDTEAGQWKPAAERANAVILAPRLTSLRGIAQPTVQDLLTDEAALNALTRRIARRYNADPDRIFITGRAGGNAVASWVGLRNPDLYRAIAIRPGGFERALLDQPAVLDRLNRIQPIFVVFSQRDLDPQASRDFIAWLRSQNHRAVSSLQLTSANVGLRGPAMAFFQRATRQWPMIRVAIESVPGPGRSRLLRATASEPITAVRWEINGELKGEQALLGHSFPEPGRYEITLAVRLEGRTEVWVRELTLDIP